MSQFWSSAMSSFSKDINDCMVSNWDILNGGIFSFVHIAGKIRRSRAFCIAYYINKASPQLKGFSITNWSACSVVVKGINRQHSCRNVLIPRLAMSCFALKSELFEPPKNWKKKACGDSDTLENWSSRTRIFSKTKGKTSPKSDKKTSSCQQLLTILSTSFRFFKFSAAHESGVAWIKCVLTLRAFNGSWLKQTYLELAGKALNC